MTFWNIRNRLGRFFLALMLLIFFQFPSAKPAAAQINSTCDYDVIPPAVRNGEQTQVVIALEPNGPRTVCQGDGGDNCYQIRTCQESTWFQGGFCHNNVNFPSENQVIIPNWNGTGVAVIQSTTGPLPFPRRFWLEKITNGVRNNNYCPGDYRAGNGPHVELIGGCTAGWATVRGQGLEPGQTITSDNAVIVTFNGNNTYGFYGAYAAGYSRRDGSGYVRLGDLYSLSGEAQGRLGTAAGNDFNLGALSAGEYKFMVLDANIVGRETYCEEAFTVCLPEDEGCTFTQETIKGEEIDEGLALKEFSYCNQIPESPQRTACETCLTSGGAGGGREPKDTIFTAVGCIRISKTGLAGDLIRLGLGIGGGLALISILAAAFMFSTSQGDSGKLKEAKELMTASVAGLFFMIFSVIILNFVGVEILKIPGLG